MSTYRQLAPNHPIAKLLAPHFDSTLAINEAAWKHLIADKGAIDKLFGASITAARGLTAQAVSSMDVNRSLLPATFEQRGVNDVESLPNYPYRDDTLLYWNAIRDWVADYIGLYYQSDAHVSEDVELQSWSTELASQDGGRIRGIGNDGSVTDLETLRDTISLIIFTCSVQHAAVNFPQYDLMSYTPCMPLAGYAPAPTSADGATEQDYLNMLPPLDMAELQMDLGFLLGTIHYTQLGQYQPGHFEDPRIDAPLQRFQGQLNEIGGIIEQRNQTRRPYHFLDPAGIPQSINI